MRQAARGGGQARGRGAAAGRPPAPAKPRGFEAPAPAKPRGFEARRLGLPRPARVATGAGGRPVAVGGTPVEAVREDWVVEDRWWTGADGRLWRRYFELVLADGRDVVVFHDLVGGGWLSQRA